MLTSTSDLDGTARCRRTKNKANNAKKANRNKTPMTVPAVSPALLSASPLSPTMTRFGAAEGAAVGVILGCSVGAVGAVGAAGAAVGVILGCSVGAVGAVGAADVGASVGAVGD